METDNVLKKFVGAREQVLKVILPKKKIIDTPCSEVYYAKPEFRYYSRYYGFKRDVIHNEELCNKAKLEASDNLSLLYKIYETLVESEFRINSLVRGPICRSSPEIMEKKKCSNWREYVIIPSKTLNPEWHAEFDNLITNYESSIDSVINKLGKGRYTVIPLILKEMKENVNKIYEKMLTMQVLNGHTAEIKSKLESDILSSSSARDDVIQISAGLEGH